MERDSDEKKLVEKSYSGEYKTIKDISYEQQINWGEEGTGKQWYVVTGDVTISSRITVTGNVHLILMDGYTLNAQLGITVEVENSLTIYAQSEGTGMGKLIATGDEAILGGAGIGGGDSGTGFRRSEAGVLTVTGGARLTAAGGDGAAANNPDNDAGQVCGGTDNSVTTTGSFIIPAGDTLTIPKDTTLTPGASTTLTNDGTSRSWGRSAMKTKRIA